MKKRYIVPVTVALEMEAEAMMALSGPKVNIDDSEDAPVIDEGADVWSLETPPNVWDEEW